MGARGSVVYAYPVDPKSTSSFWGRIGMDFPQQDVDSISRVWSGSDQIKVWISFTIWVLAPTWSCGCQCRTILYFTQAQTQGDPIQGFSIYGHFSVCSSLCTAFWWLLGRDCNWMKYSSQIFRKESNSRVSAMEIMVFLMGFFLFCSAEIQHSKIRSDYHFIIPFKEFGFTHRGLLEIYVKDSSYNAIKENDIDLESMGFFLSARDV